MKVEHRMTCPKCGNAYYEHELPRDGIAERCPFRMGRHKTSSLNTCEGQYGNGNTGRRVHPEVRDSFEGADDEDVPPSSGLP
jgi:hypothetical protein